MHSFPKVSNCQIVTHYMHILSNLAKLFAHKTAPVNLNTFKKYTEIRLSSRYTHPD